MRLDESSLPQHEWPNVTCPHDLTQRQYNNIDHNVCGHPNSGMSAHTFFSSQGIHYN